MFLLWHLLWPLPHHTRHRRNSRCACMAGSTSMALGHLKRQPACAKARIAIRTATKCTYVATVPRHVYCPAAGPRRLTVPHVNLQVAFCSAGSCM